MSQHEVTLLLGSNLGNPKKNVEEALCRIKKEIGTVIKESEMLFTDPVEFVSNNIFCNIAVIIKTQFSPIKLLNSVKLIERDMGRVDDTMILGEYEDRTIDVDIVRFNALQFFCEDLIIPHQKHLYQRDFSRKLLDAL